MEIDVLGLMETFWDGEGDFRTDILSSTDTFRVIYAGGTRKRRGVALVLRNKVGELSSQQ